jgi:hypothetical protein
LKELDWARRAVACGAPPQPDRAVLEAHIKEKTLELRQELAAKVEDGKRVPPQLRM